MTYNFAVEQTAGSHSLAHGCSRRLSAGMIEVFLESMLSPQLQVGEGDDGRRC
jgi:hypothetical protein